MNKEALPRTEIKLFDFRDADSFTTIKSFDSSILLFWYFNFELVSFFFRNNI